MTDSAPIDPAALDKAIAQASAGYDDAGRADRAPAAHRLGRLLLVRHLRPGGDRDIEDRDRAIRLFEESLTAGGLAAGESEVSRIGLGLLLMLRVMPLPELPTQPPSLAALGALTGVQPDTGPQARTDLAAAVAHLRSVVEGPTQYPELATVSRTMLTSLLVMQMSMNDDQVSPTELIALLGELTTTMTAADPLRDPASLLLGVLADDLSPEHVKDLERMAVDLPPGEIKAFVRQQLGLSHIRHGSPDEHVDAVRQFTLALDDLAPHDDLYPEALRRLAGAVLTDAALRGDPVAVDGAIDLADRVLALPGDDPVVRGKDLFLRAMAWTLRGHRDDTADDLLLAARDLLRALDDVPAADPLAPSIVGMLGALLNDRGLAGGVLEDGAAARGWMRKAAHIADLHRETGTLLGDISPIVALNALGRTATAVRHGTPEELAAATGELRDALRELPADFAWRSRIEAALGLAGLAQAMAAGDLDGLRAAADQTAAAAAGTAVEPSGEPTLRALGGVALLVRGLLDDDEAALAAAGERLDEAVGAEVFGAVQRTGVYATRALARLALHERSERAADLDAAIADLEHARRLIGDRPGSAVAGTVLHRLADAYGKRGEDGDLERAVRTGLAGLRARVSDVLLQNDGTDALTVARGAAEESCQVARRCLDPREPRPELAAQALELGRGLALHAAMSAGRVPELLTAAGHADLAQEWTGHPHGRVADFGGFTLGELTELGHPVLGGEAPSDLRRRVLVALAGTENALLEAPDPAAVGAAVREVGADALIYLAAGLIVVIRADGSVTAEHVAGLSEPPPTAADGGSAVLREATATVPRRAPGDLGRLCEWAWTAAVEPLFTLVSAWRLDHPARLVLVPVGALGEVPWHAARRPATDGQRYACEEAVFSYAASARQLVDVAGRLPMPVAAAPAVLADPTGDLPWSAQEVGYLLAEIYPDAAQVTGTAREVLAQLPGTDRLGASMLHLSCHGRVGARPGDSRLELAGESLPVSVILGQAYGRRPDVPGGLVVLASCKSDLTPDLTDETLTLSTAFLAAGAVGVVGSRWAVDDRATMYLMIMFHVFMLEERLSPADALRAAQLWMLDPQRPAPGLVPHLLDDLENPNELSDVAAWAAFRHHGR
ncbi:CHAT domain-containing protein [Actinoplanes sp. RD1]|uniref:CHAT domain-containing protein n=1 Tax=Actinoplanes sp. RD1 TaxID=3064538 RepID=UPI002740760C|nr:CHAT domain-containing protein [Actinoplanes sp. RD1]